MNVIEALGYEETGEIVVFKEYLDDGTRALVVGHTDEERVVRIAQPLLDQRIRAGDSLLNRSGLSQRTHPEALMVGFYFFDVPFGSSAAAFFDPRPGKVATPLAEANKAEITDASNQFYMTPRPGLLLLTNSWLPHAFTRHDGETPLRFVHFNIGLAEHVERDLPEVI